MSESKFLSCLFTEGIFLTTLGILMLILPKVTPVTFGFMLCFAFLAYGGYKAINAFLIRNFSKYYIFSVISGIILFIAGVLLLFAPMVDIMLIISFLAIYFITESLSTSATVFRARNILKNKFAGHLTALFQFLLGLLIIVILPSTALWLIGVLAGIDFLITGIVFLNMFFASNYKY